MVMSSNKQRRNQIRKLLLATAAFLIMFYTTLAAPAQAAGTLSEDETAMILAKFTLYELKCGPVSSKTQQVLRMLEKNIGNSKIMHRWPSSMICSGRPATLRSSARP
jgi:hypothetical protein